MDFPVCCSCCCRRRKKGKPASCAGSQLAEQRAFGSELCGREPALPAFSTDAHPRKMFMGGTRPAIPCQHFRGVCYQKRVLFSLQVSYINACLWLCFFPYTCFLTLLMGYMRTLAERPCTSQQNMVPSRGRAPHRL